MINGLTHSGFAVSNLETALDFFKENLKIEEIRSQVSDQDYLSKVTGFPGASLKIGFVRKKEDTFPLEVIEYITPKGQPTRSGIGIVGTQHRCYEVSNLDAWYSHLIDQGVKFLSEPRQLIDGFWPDLRGVFFYGPDNTIFEFIESRQDSPGDPEIKRIHHLGMTVSDIPNALDLLCGNLGLKKIEDKELNWGYIKFPGVIQDTQLKTTLLNITGTQVFLELLQFRSPAGPPALTAHNNFGSGHLCFQVDDIFNDYAILKRAGVKFVGPPAEVTAGINKGAYAIYFSDFDDYRFELFQKSVL
jgi:catechol 2,3-dioxygenase-like lactoylglutathione lyase family enzyme